MKPNSHQNPYGSHRHRRKRHRKHIPWDAIVPVSIFALIIFLGPLLFGAVDRPTQIGLIALLALGLFTHPPAVASLTRRGSTIALIIVTIFLLKEFAPHAWFGPTAWRSELAEKYGVDFPSTHHPEPSRALDALLAGTLALLWFQWVRTLAAARERRLWMAWIVAGAGAFIAIVCFTATRSDPQSQAIFGVRYTEGWVGWGPFPNRNHTASFLAMCALVTLGCTLASIARRKRRPTIAGAVLFLLTLSALLASKSRGALLAFTIGLIVFLVLLIIRHPTRKMFWMTCGVLIAITGLVFIFGGELLERFRSQEGGSVSNQMRLMIWREALAIWRDAPLFGHGLDTFGALFPLYQKGDYDGQTVLHPESSWLLWLCEIGALPLALLSLVTTTWVGKHLRTSLQSRRGFYITAALVAATLTLLAHAAIDIPAHRWGTTGIALAILALATPPHKHTVSASRAAIIPAAIAVFWAMPYFGYGPSWAAVQPALLITREEPSPLQNAARPRRPSLEEWQSAAAQFPLNPSLHQYAGLRALDQRPPAPIWEWHFALARRLAGSNWWFPAMQAMSIRRQQPTTSIRLWQDAIDRSGRRRAEILRNALITTGGTPAFSLLWMPFIEQRPELALAYARAIVEEHREPPADLRATFDLWWENRALRNNPLTPSEYEDYYTYATHWSSPAQLQQFIRAHPKRLPTDYRTWMHLLHSWGEDTAAWKLYTLAVKEPKYSSEIPEGATRASLEAHWLTSPENPIHALHLAAYHEGKGDLAAAAQVITQAAARPDAAPWFTRKAAFLLAAQGSLNAAVATALREK